MANENIFLDFDMETNFVDVPDMMKIISDSFGDNPPLYSCGLSVL